MLSHDRKPLRAAVAGALSVDICPEFPGVTATEGSEMDFGDIILPGKITHIDGNQMHPGGPVANTGMALSIFGVEPILLARIGDDDFGQLLRTMLIRGTGEYSVNSLIVDKDIGAYTAYSLILAPSGIDRAILQNPGANDRFEMDDIDFEYLVSEGCRLLHFGHPSSMHNMFVNEGEQLMNIMKSAREHGLVTSLDLCVVDKNTEAGEHDWMHILRRVLPYVDFFVPSYDDICDIFSPGEHPEAAYLAIESISMGASNVFLKLGTEGTYFCNGDALVFRDIESRLGFESGSMESWEERVGRAKGKIIENVVSGLGAGDTAIAAYLSAMLRGYDFDDAIDIAMIEGGLCVTQASATGGLVPFEDLDI